MKKFIALSLVATAALSLTACGAKTEENTAVVDNAATTDLNSAASEAIADVNAAAVDATAGTENAVDAAANGADAMAENTSNAM